MVAFAKQIDSVSDAATDPVSTPLLDAIVVELKQELQRMCDEERLRRLAWHVLNEAFLALDEKSDLYVIHSECN